MKQTKEMVCMVVKLEIKKGVTIDGEYWIVKYPKSTKGMEGELDPYTTSPLSEYIGSHIYQMLGIETHDTILGIRNNKLVVACKDFCRSEGSLREMRTLENVYDEVLAEKLEQSISPSSSTTSSHFIDMEDVFLQLQFNPILSKIPNVESRFWEQFLVDMLINNNDRNSGNWGILYENGRYRLAPVFDNGESFFNKTPERKLFRMSVDKEYLQQSINSSMSVYRINGHRIHGKDMINIENENFYKTAAVLIPNIKERMEEILDFVQKIPERLDDITICSDARKRVYTQSMEIKMEQFFMPVYAKC